MAKDQEHLPQQPHLTVNDPVSPDELARMEELDRVKGSLALKNLNLDQEKIQIMGAVRRIDAEYQKVFEKILIERGLPPQTQISVEKNGQIKVISQNPGPSVPESDSKPTEEV